MAGLDLLGTAGDDKLRRDRMRARRSMLGTDPTTGEHNTGWHDPEGGFGSKLKADQANLDLFRERQAEILGNLDNYGKSAKQGAYDTYQQNLGDASQRAIDTGRYSTSQHDQQRMQAAGEYNRAVTDINSSLASTYSNVAMQGMNTEIGLNTQVGYSGFDRAMFEANNWWPTGTPYMPSGGGLLDFLGSVNAVANTAGNVMSLGSLGSQDKGLWR